MHTVYVCDIGVIVCVSVNLMCTKHRTYHRCLQAQVTGGASTGSERPINRAEYQNKYTTKVTVKNGRLNYKR